MELIINGLIENIKLKKISEILKDNVYDLVAIISIVLTLVADLGLLICSSQNKTIGTYISIGLLVLFIIISEIFISLGGKFYSTSNYAKEDKIRHLNDTIKHIRENGIVDISNNKDMQKLTEYIKKYYNNKFSTVDYLQKVVTQIGKFVLLPIILAIANSILETKNEEMLFENKLFYIGLCLITVFFVTLSVIMVFELCKSIIKFKNIRLFILLSDLELLSNFDLVDGIKFKK